MTEQTYDKTLEQKVMHEITYTLSLFNKEPPPGKIFSPYQSRIAAYDMELIDFSSNEGLEKLKKSELISPKDILEAKLKEHIRELYDSVQIRIPLQIGHCIFLIPQ